MLFFDIIPTESDEKLLEDGYTLEEIRNNISEDLDIPKTTEDWGNLNWKNIFLGSSLSFVKEYIIAKMEAGF